MIGEEGKEGATSRLSILDGQESFILSRNNQIKRILTLITLLADDISILQKWV